MRPQKWAKNLVVASERRVQLGGKGRERESISPANGIVGLEEKSIYPPPPPLRPNPVEHSTTGKEGNHHEVSITRRDGSWGLSILLLFFLPDSGELQTALVVHRAML